MQKTLFLDVERCAGCGMCEIACAWHRTNTCNPAKSAIRILKNEEFGIDVPIVCSQCEEPPCIKVCPTNAISRDIKTGTVIVNELLCIGCKACMVACPFGAISIEMERGKIIKCDLCGGDPECVKVCPKEAIMYITYDRGTMKKKRAFMEKLSRFYLEAREI